MNNLDNLNILLEPTKLKIPTQKDIENTAMFLLKGFPLKPIYAYRKSNGKLQIIQGSELLLGLYLFYKGKHLNDNSNLIFNFENVLGYINNFKSLEDILSSSTTLSHTDYKLKIDEESLMDISYNNLPIDVKKMLNKTPLYIFQVNLLDVADTNAMVTAFRELLK